MMIPSAAKCGISLAIIVTPLKDSDVHSDAPIY